MLITGSTSEILILSAQDNLGIQTINYWEQELNNINKLIAS